MFIYPWLLVTEKSDSGLNIDFQLNILKFCFSRVDNQGFVRTRFRILKNRLDPGKTGVLYVNVKNSGCLKSDLIQLRKKHLHSTNTKDTDLHFVKGRFWIRIRNFQNQSDPEQYGNV